MGKEERKPMWDIDNNILGGLGLISDVKMPKVLRK
jgi:hypothetical protein